MKLKHLFILLGFSLACALKAQVPNYVPLNGLQAFWLFTGNANDAGSNNYVGTVNNASLTTDRFGSANSAYSFDGSTSYISTNYPGVLGNNSRAVSFWAKTNVNAAEPLVVWGDNQQGPNAGCRFDCSFDWTSGGATIDVSDAALTYSANSNVNDNNWHHYVFQFNATNVSQVEVYQDAILLTQVIASFQPNTTVNTLNNFNVYFGHFPYTTPYFYQGQLDDIGIWNRKLTLCEIRQLYTSSLPIITVSGTANAICTGQSATLTASGSSSYTWSTLSNNASIIVSPTITSSYSITGTDTHGCSGTASITLEVRLCTGIETHQLSSEWQVSPNPTTGIVRLINATGLKRIDVYSLLGEHIYGLNSEEENPEIDLSMQPAGIYLLKINSGQRTVIRKVIKE